MINQDKSYLHFPPNKCLHELFEWMVSRQPDAIALVFGERRYTYREVDEKANQIAHFLISQNVQKEDLVAISVERSAEMIIGILGILKAGAAYLPIDPQMPTERIVYFLKESNASVILTQQGLLSLFDRFAINKLILNPDVEKVKEFPATSVNVESNPSQLAYTIFTSGSTGKPKGVQVEHHSVVNLVQGQLAFVQHPVDRFLYAYSFAFDGSVLLIFWTLLSGGTLVMAPEGLEKDITQIANFIRQQKITHLLTFSSLYKLLLEQADKEGLKTLQSVSVAGEVCPPNLVKQHHNILPDCVLLNQYGPTEATVGATIYKTTAASGYLVRVPIGKSIDQVRIYILDESLNQLAPGEVGDLYISGLGVARGYLNRPDLTKERFINNPFAGAPFDRLYKTGDLAILQPDGNVDFIGRSDFQVKLRGYRIEPEEIESVLTSHPTIREATVLLKGEQSAEQKLVAYIVLKKEASINNSELRRFLAKQLPEYMIPAVFIMLSKMPLTTTGKVDRSALPEIGSERPALAQAYLAPRSILEKKLVEDWQQILNLEKIGVDDKFFELGGNSLQAADFIGRLQDQLDEVIFITSIFDHPTIASFAKMLERDYANAVARCFYYNGNSDTSDKEIKPKLAAKEFKNFDAYVPGLKKLEQENLSAQNTTKLKQAVFILAPPRSGTSLLRIMLAGHPKLFASNELQLLHFETLKERNDAYQGKFSLWSEGLIRVIMELEKCSADEAKEIIQQYINEGFSTRKMYAELQNKLEDQLLVDKSPSYALDLKALQKAESDFDKPIYLHLLRHPYAMVRSFTKMHMDQIMYLKPHQHDARTLGELIWTRSHQNVSKFLQNVPGERQFRIQYEDMVQHPEVVMKQLCEKLGWDYTPALINPYEDLNNKMVDGLYDESKPMGDIRLLEHGKIDPKLADSWKGVEKDNFLSKTTWSIAESYGYKNPEGKTKPANKESEKQIIKSRDIAIIGMSGRFPGADNIEQFWDNLKNGTDVSKTFTAEDLIKEGLDPALLDNPDYVNRGMPLKDAGHFAAEFFGYLPKEAALMDPQHRVFLECAYTALEDAGYHSENSDQRIGVYGAIARNTYLVNNVMTHPQYFQSIDDFQLGVALEKDFPATRVAYQLNLKGPAVNIQTACSSSGVALHLACQSILLEESDIMLVGGGRIQPPIYGGHIHKEGHALSSDGYVRAFDEDAKGMVRGHGMAFIVIKKLEKALADGDTIHAVIKGSAIGNDGNDKIGFTAPGIEGQSRTIIQAYENAGIDPATLSYIETHGTGTRLGDPVEIAALTKAFAKYTDKKRYCAIGSVKTNIGHLDAGACIAGIIKTVLALKEEKLPANLHFKKTNPQISFDKSPFYVNGKLSEWKKGDKPRRAGVSSFGLGGTNAHIVLEEAPLQQESTEEAESQLLVLSAKTATALDLATKQLGEFLRRKPNQNLSHVAATLQLGRKEYTHRRILVANNMEDAAAALQQNSPQRITTSEGAASTENIVFMFPGGGAQHTNMGLGLYETEAVFRESVDRCLNILQTKHQLELRKVLYPDHRNSEPITDALEGITLLFSIEYAMAKLWMSKGIQPTEMIGHSLGEYVAACLAGVFSLEDAMALVAKRGKLFLQLDEGGMLSIPLSEKEIMPYMDEALSLAAINKPDYCVVSGPSKAIDRIKEKLTEDEIHAPRLHINVAAHSAMVDTILDEFGSFLENITFHAPTIPIVSNLNGVYAQNGTMQGPEYWKKHLRQTVRFADGMTTLLKEEQKVFLEVGPGQMLSTFTRQHPDRTGKHIVIASLRHPKETIEDRLFFLKSMGQLWLAGLSIDWKQNFESVKRVSLPTYPFERKHYWIDAKITATFSESTIANFTTSNMENKLEEQPLNQPKLTRKDWLKKELKNIFHHLSGLPVGNMADHATFLELGFDSLFLTQAITKIIKAFGIKVNFRQLFDEAPSIDSLAQFIDAKLPNEAFEEEIRQLNTSQLKSIPTKQIQTPSKPGFLPPVPSLNTSLPQSPVSGNIEILIQQQLILMQQQLDLLRGERNPTGFAEAAFSIDESESQKLVSSNLEDTPATGSKEEGKPKDFTAFGPWVPIEKKSRADLTEREKKYLDDLIVRYTTRTKSSQQLSQSQRKHMADPRSIVGFNPMWKDMIYQIAMDRSKGAKMWDVDGNEYIDFRSSFGVNLFGHSPDFLQQAIIEQVNKGFELGVLTPLAEKVCDLICELTGTERASLVNTGSEAVSAAVRAARTATGKDKIVVFEGDYHGIADELLVKGISRGGQDISLPAAPGIPHSLVDQVIVLKYDDPDVLAKIKAHAGDLAAVIIEPIQPNNPTHQPVELFRAIRKLTEEEDIALVFDELITGFRISVGGAQAWYGIEVDIIAYGKALSGGLPMAAVAGKSKFLDVFDGGQWEYGDDSIPEAGVTFFGGTFCKHPVSLAASLAALQEIKRQGQRMYDDLNAKTARFSEKLIDLFERTKVPIQVRSTASIVAIKIIDKNPLSSLFFYYLRLKGIFIEDKAALITVAHSEEDLDTAFQMFEETIREMQTAGFFQITVADIAVENRIVLAPSQNIPQNTRVTGGVKKMIPLTEGQKEIWVEHQLGKEAAAAYNLAGDLHLVGKLDVTLFKQAVHDLVHRHEALSIVFNKEEPTQRLQEKVEIVLPIVDLSQLDKEEQSIQLKELRDMETKDSMDLFNGPLIRFKLVKLAKEDHHFFMTAHHGIADGWSCGLLARDLGMLYSKACGLEGSLDIAKPLSDFAFEREQFKKSEAYREAEQFWLQQFTDGIPVLEFPTDRSRPPVKTYNAAFEKIVINRKLTKQLKKMSVENGSTLFVSLYAAFQAFIYRLSNQEEFVLGMVAAAQAIAGNQHLVAHGVSLLPVKAVVDGTATFTAHLKNTRNRILNAFEHQDYTLGALVKKLNMARDASRQPIISILVNMDTDFGHLHYGDLAVALNPIPRKFESFDIFFNVKVGKDLMELEWTYNTDLFDSETIRHRLTEFEVMLQSIADQPSQSVDRLDILPPSERHQLLIEWNQTDAPFPDQLCVHELFEQQVLKTPKKQAVACLDVSLNYQQLNERANQIAHFLLLQGVKTGDFVAIFMERSVELLIGLMAILKAGGIYVPLDPGNPQDRLNVIIEDAEAEYLLTKENMINRLPAFEGKTFSLEREAKSIRACSKDNPEAPVASKNLAYVIYTSGSTGRPKGVIIPHYAVIDHHLAMIKAIGVKEDEVILSVASVSFDPSVQDFFMPLFIGAKVVIASQEEVTDGYLLKERLDKSEITLMQATPATWLMLISAGWKGKPDLKVKSVGEGLTAEMADQLLARSKALWNAYGPSETTIYTTTKKIERNPDSKHRTTGYEPVGRPMDNVKVYILDSLQQPVPIGAAGEVYVGGVGVAPGGYFKREELTLEKFVENPFHPDKGNKLYRTGDLAKYLPNGDIEFLGRVDHQVKVRGFRIELGEIESLIAKYPSVHAVVVLVREDVPGDKRIVAYLTLKDQGTFSAPSLKSYLKEKLPEYMIPSAIVVLEAFPLTATLKVNRKKLPLPDYSRDGMLESGFVASRNKKEVVLTEIWKELLRIDKIGVFDNFFELGGHSLIAAKMMTVIKNRTGKWLPLSSLLENPTISDLANLLENHREIKRVESRSLVPIKTDGNKIPIYLVHGAGLHVLMFQTLAANMDKEQPIYALQARGLYGEVEPLETIEEIAAHYISEIMAHNREGPYMLAGYSFGGLIAFEMAKQLKAQRKEIAMLGMFDTVVRLHLSENGQSRSYYQQLKDLGKKVSFNLSILAKAPIANLKYKSHVLKRRYQRWTWNRQYKGQKELQEENTNFAALVDRMNQKAFEQYKIQPYDGEIFLFRAKEQRFYLEDFEFLGWEPLALKGVIIKEIPGDHLNLFNPPNGVEFARILQQAIHESAKRKKNHGLA